MSIIFCDVDLSTLLTTIVENLNAVSHFKNETFTALQYARDLHNGKRINKKERQSGAPNTLHMTSRFIQFQYLVWSWQMLK